MAAKIRTVDFLPEIFQTPGNKQFLEATLDQLVQEPQFKQTQGYIGRKVGPGVNPNDGYVVEPTKVRNDYQLEPGVVSLNPTTLEIDDVITYPGMIDALTVQGGITNKADRLFESEFYTWDPFVDFDKYINYSQYYWLPEGPDAVVVSATSIATEQTFTVTRANGAYTFSGYTGTNPAITLVRNGSYNFNIAQNSVNAIDYRLTNNGTSSWAIDFEPNPTLTLVRGNTYTWNLIQSGPYKFFIKTEPSYGTTNLYNEGVLNQGAFEGLVTFTVPQDAPNTLYYCNDLEFNLRGQMNIIDASPGTGPDFWIQTQPGINGVLPWSPNISSRDVLGVSNNGIDLGTVDFNVPNSTAQNFYYSMPYINYPTTGVGRVDLIVPPTIQFDQINGLTVDQFLTTYPAGIDGITNLNSRTLVFTTQSTDVDDGGWYVNSGYDPLPSTSTNPVGGFDTTTFSQAVPITEQSTQFSVWQIQYITDAGGVQFIQLNSILSVENLTQFSIGFGTQYVNTQWYKNAQGYFEQMPLLTATLPLLFYQDGKNPNIFGQINLIDADLNATINVNTDILGKINYTSPNGVTFTNGLKVTLQGNVIPAEYQGNTYYVYGVGTGIVLYSVDDYVVPEIYTKKITSVSVTGASGTGTQVTLTYTEQSTIPFTANQTIVVSNVNSSAGDYNGVFTVIAASTTAVIFDSTTTGTYTGGGAIVGSGNEPLLPDYVTISMASPDLNPWSRSNRWFHVEVISATATYNKITPSYLNSQRANRPILEFRGGTRLFNFGTEGITPVNVIDLNQTNALENVNGQYGYGIDGYTLIQDSLVVFAADTDPTVRNQIYQVNFIVPAPDISTRPIIDLVPIANNPVIFNQVTVCLDGLTLQGQSFQFDGDTWTATQQKTAVNQPPLFDVYNPSGISFSDQTYYPSSNFVGSKLYSYAENPNNPVDPVLGIPLDFYSLNTIGDILFDNNLYNDTFVYTQGAAGITLKISTGFVRQYEDRLTFINEIGWQTATVPALPRQQFQFTYNGNPLQLDVLISTTLDVTPAQVFVNNTYQLPSSYTITTNTQTNTSVITLNGNVVIGDIVEILVYSDDASTQGFYQVPINLENNPFNVNSPQFTLGSARSHYATICENLLDLQGVINGPNNTRDLGNIGIYGQQILQQSSPMTLAGYFLRSPDYNIFAALNYNSREYIKYKNKLLTAVTQLDIGADQTVSSILDQALTKINTSLTSSDSFYWSDMLPCGSNYTSNTTVVNPVTISTFNTVQTYDFASSNYQGLLVYVNNMLLLRGIQYTVSSVAPKLTILVPLQVGDVIVINEYLPTIRTIDGSTVSTNPSPNWCPNTPSKMGLYPKYTPEIYVDESYSEPTVVIQGHDGSITIAFSDIRDQVLLEFEKRIYNNIKVDKNPIPLSTDEVSPYFYPEQTTALLPGFFRKTPYTYDEVNQMLSEDFLSWVGQNKVDYTQQNYIASNPFTYNYSQSANRINGDQMQQGNWRGINRYFYDTETPNTTPWEMLGFSEEPLWWMERYGPAPYTSGNTVLWDDLEAGLVADPLAPYILPEYIRPGLSKVIPVGTEGELLPPLESTVGLNDPYGFQQSWKAGDGGPVQASWWNSSSYPFAIMRLLALTKPAQFFSLFADRDLYRYNTALGQFLYNDRYRLDASGVQIYGNGVSKASYINWIVDYNQQLGIDSTTKLTVALANLDVRLCYRMASFSDSTYLSIFTERSGPGSTNNSLLLPPTSYNLLFYKNQPFNQITYSSVIVQVEQLGTGGIGYTVYGYSNIQPYFEVLVSSPAGVYQTITAGGLSVQVPAQYTDNVSQIPYGYTFTNPSSVCDFLLGYGAWLESQGLIFDNIENGYTLNWKQMAQEFLYFSAQGWTESTMINLNPCATTITASQPISIVDTIASLTPENMLLDQNRTVLDVRNMIVQRSGNQFSVTTTNNQTINFLTLKFTNYEDMVVLDNTSQFNDLIYDPATGARQSRLSIVASTSTEWDGQLNAQGFILNLNNVEQWTPYTKYTKGDITLYKNTYWQALNIIQPQETFNYNEWIKSNYQLIDTGLLPNLANKADQLANTYSIYKANLASDNDLFAFALIGFRPRQYMSEMNLSGVAQVQIYQQFLGTKGTLQAAEIFRTANLGKEVGQYDVYENWGILAGTYGAQANKSFIDIQLNQALLQYNPSTIQIINPGDTSQANQTLFISDLWKESYPINSIDILPTTYENSSLPEALPTAGYVNLNNVDITVFSIDDPTAIDTNIDNIGIGTYIWIAKINSYDWGVYRVAKSPGQLTSLFDNLDGTCQAQFNTVTGLAVSDLIIIKYFNAGVNGVYRVLATPTPTTIIIEFSFTNTNITTLTGTGLVFKLQNARVSQASDIATLPFVDTLVPGSIAWVDNDGNGHWETVQKQSPFVIDVTLFPGIASTTGYGTSVTQSSNNLGALVGAPGANTVFAYNRPATIDYSFNRALILESIDASGYGNFVSFGGAAWAVAGASTSLNNIGYATTIYRNPSLGGYLITQLLVPPDQNFSAIKFGSAGVISADENWMYIGAPDSNTVYAYTRVLVETQEISYIGDGSTSFYFYNNAIQINYLYPDQLKVTLGDQEMVLNQDYTINQDYVIFTVAPPNTQTITFSRRQTTQLDQVFYYGIQQNTTSGSGFGAVFSVNNIRGEYLVTLNAGGLNYNIGDTLTVYGTQLGGTTPANNLTLTVTDVNGGKIATFSISGSGNDTTSVFALNTWLFTATSISNFSVFVDNVIQRPYLDYTFNESTTELTFITVPGYGAEIVIDSGTYWQYVTDITTTSAIGDQFGLAISTTTDGQQVTIGAPTATANGIVQAGTVYVFDRSVLNYLVTNTATMTYTIPGTITLPIIVSVNNVYLLSTSQSINGQYTLNGNQVIFNNITFTLGDIIEFGTNQFQQIQQLISDTPSYEATYGSALATCPENCSLYIGAPLDSTYLAQSGSVDRQVNQSRVYGITTTTIANPTLTPGGTLRINNVQVSVPEAPYNNIDGLITAINSALVPNAVALPTSNLTFIGDGTTKIFNIGTLYSAATSYTTVVYVDDELLIAGVDYSYNSATQQIYFVYAPISNAVIKVVSGRMTISVQNAEAAIANNMLTVLPGTVNSVFDELGFDTLVFTQQILSPLPIVYGQFGASVSINSTAVSLIVGSPNGNVYEPTTFDAGQTYFDEHSTTFFNPINNGGVTYTYDYFPSSTNNVNNPGKFAFGQQVYNDITQQGDGFGTSVSFVNGILLVGATGSKATVITNFGYATAFNNPNNSAAWAPIQVQQPVVDVYKIDGVFAYNGGQAIGVNEGANAGVQTYFDFFDPLQGKILGAARSNINYIGAVDPAEYNTGAIHDNGNSWGSERLGEMWWDTDTVRFIDPNQDDIIYASRKWGAIFPGSRVDIYQWVESTTPPTSYTGQGTPFSTISYTVSSQLGQNNVFQTLYYFWVRGISTIAIGAGKTLSATGVASYITDPRSSGLPYIAALNANTVAIYNAQNLLQATNTILSIGFDRQLNDDVVHQEYQLIQDGVAGSFLNPNLYRKFQDSLCGVDTSGARVPDTTLSPGMRYGVQFRPRQSMFADRFTALQNYLGRANTVLAQFPISETRSFNLLNAAEPYPAAGSGAWDMLVPNLEVLGYQNLVLVPTGYRYLVINDSSQQGRWTIYEVEADNTLLLAQVQSYDTPLYWYYINWYLPGYNSSIAPVAAVQNYGQLATLSYETAPIGSSVRVVSNGAGKFEIYLRTTIDPANGWKRVGLEDGTIAFKEELWNYPLGNFGFDAEVFDAQYFDEEPVTETRFIIRALNEEIYVDDLEIQANSSLMLMFNYAYSEFTDPSWLVKTSYVDVNHNIRQLQPYQTYLQDNQNFVIDYFQEVKPYHVQVRQFNLIYTGEDNTGTDVTDFDVPAYYDLDLEVPQFVSPILTPYTEAITPYHSNVSNAASNAQIWLESPWREWYNNYLLSIEGVTVVNGGTGYTVPPVVTVTGTCVTPAVMTAVINGAGHVVGIVVVDPGAGYSTTATITLTGGNGAGAQAVAQMGNPLVRSIRTTIKYDRYQYQTTLVEWEPSVVYDNGTQVRHLARVWEASNPDGSTVTGTVFDPAEWNLVDVETLSGVDRTMGFYVSTVNTPGLSLPLLIDGIDYPGVQVIGVNFDQDTGFDRGNFDINPWDNISIDANGQPTYDLGILDTIFESSYLDPYLGVRPADINVSGGAYVDTYESHAPEELVPGIEFDTLDFRVYTTPGADWRGLGHGFPQYLSRAIYNSAEPTISFANQLPYPVAVVIYNTTQSTNLVLGVDYTVEWTTQTITVESTVNNGNELAIYVYELGGGNQLYKNIYNGEDVGNTLPVPVQYSLIQEFAIFINGVYLSDTEYSYAIGTAFGTTTVTFNATYTSNDFISLVVIGPTTIDSVTTDYSWSIPYTYAYTATGSLTYDLLNTLQYTNSVNAIVNVGGIRAKTAGGIDHLSNGSNTVYGLPQRLGIDESTISSSDIEVYFDDILQDPLTWTLEAYLGGFSGDYPLNDFSTAPFSPTPGTVYVVVDTAPPVGTRVYIAVWAGWQARIDPIANTLTFNPTGGLIPIAGQIITVTTWNDTREQRLLTQVFVGAITTGVEDAEPFDTTSYDAGVITYAPGSYDYSAGIIVTSNSLDLGRLTNNIDRLWVSLNGRWLTPTEDYIVEGTYLILINYGILSPTDTVIVTQVTNSVVPEALEFRIFQDMRGVQATYRITPETTTTLAQSLSATDDIIYVADAGALTIPNFSANIWGVITINGERIMYREINFLDNTVSSLLRGTGGTGADSHEAGAYVYDMGRGNLLPAQFQNYIESDYILADGTTTTYVTTLNLDNNNFWTGTDPYDYTPFSDGTIVDEPGSYDWGTGGSNQRAVEVYVGGELQVGNYTVTALNPVTVVFATPPADGSGVTILIRRGVTWYQQGIDTASDGVPLQETETAPARFLRGL